MYFLNNYVYYFKIINNIKILSNLIFIKIKFKLEVKFNFSKNILHHNNKLNLISVNTYIQYLIYTNFLFKKNTISVFYF